MATILRINYDPSSANLSLTEKARQILEMRGSDEVITVTDPALLLEIERVNRKEIECKLHIAYVEKGEEKSSYGYGVDDGLRAILPNL